TLTTADRTDHVVEFWIGMSPGHEQTTRVKLVWGPRSAGPAAGGPAPATVSATATGKNGDTYFDGTIDTTTSAAFDAPPGEIVLKTVVRDVRGDTIDGESRKITVPSFAGADLTIGSPMVLRARNAIEVRNIVAGREQRPSVDHEFDRTDRLFIRFAI